MEMRFSSLKSGLNEHFNFFFVHRPKKRLNKIANHLTGVQVKHEKKILLNFIKKKCKFINKTDVMFINFVIFVYNWLKRYQKKAHKFNGTEVLICIHLDLY